MVMDYWCSLWFWDMRNAEFLPSRQQYLNDISSIINVNLSSENSEQLGLGFEESIIGVAQSQIIQKTEKSDLFDNKERLSLVKESSDQNRFFHSQLEFIEVFLENGGFDIIVGNPPWLKVLFQEKDVISENYPELLIRKTKAPVVRKFRSKYLEIEKNKSIFLDEFISLESSTTFLNSFQNYPLLKGQQTNLYKCIIENSLYTQSKFGFVGLLHPEGVYDDPRGSNFREELYPRLYFRFQFDNVLYLFAEIKDGNKFSVNVYGTRKDEICFQSINNLFTPKTIDGCMSHSGSGIPGGLKIKIDDKYEWNIRPHRDRILTIRKNELGIFKNLIDDNQDWKSCKLVSIHSKSLLNILEKISDFESRVIDFENKITECWDETNDVNKGTIIRETYFPNINNYEYILSGPHVDVSNPISQSPRSTCKLKSDYDNIDLSRIDKNYLPRVNYKPNIDLDQFSLSSIRSNENYLDRYKICYRKMLSQPRVRTLLGAILPPKSSHINGLISIVFNDDRKLVELCGLSSSLVYDFYIKSIGKSNMYRDTLNNFPLGIDNHIRKKISSRTLLLNCINSYYSDLWNKNYEENFKSDSWCKVDSRLSEFNSLRNNWDYSTPIRIPFERRQALIEIDVLTSIALGLNINDLISIYEVQFPVLQKMEDNTYYDSKGEIVFTTSQSHSDIGVDRPIWDTIRNMKDRETYEHIIEKSELYLGEKVIYYAPFEKCDRVEDYKVAWAHFEKIFNQN